MSIRSRHSARRLRRSAPFAPVSTSPLAFPARTRTRARLSLHDARRVSMCALAMGSILCAGALLAGPVVAAPVVGNDENGPLVQIIRPGYNDVLKGKYRILIAVTAKKYNPQSVEMFVDDKSATGGPKPLSSLASSSFDWDTHSIGDGKHKLTVRVTDAQGFSGWSEVTVFVNNGQVVDSTPPDLKWVGVAPFQQFSGTIPLEVSAADNFGVKLLQIFINPIEAPNRTPAMFSWLLNQPPYRVNLDTIGKRMPDGLYSLKALAFDSGDQQGEAPPLTIGIVNNAVSPTTVGEMLQGLREMAQAQTKANGPASSGSGAAALMPPAATSTPRSTPLAGPSAPAPTTSTPPASTPPAATGTTLRAGVPAGALRSLPAIPSNPGINVPRVTPPRRLPNEIEKPLADVPANGSTPSVETQTNATQVAPPASDALQSSAPGEFAPGSVPAKEPEPAAPQNSAATPDTTATPSVEASAESLPGAATAPSATTPDATTPSVGTSAPPTPGAEAANAQTSAPQTSATGSPAAPTPDASSLVAEAPVAATSSAPDVPAPAANASAPAANASAPAPVQTPAHLAPAAPALSPNARPDATQAPASNRVAPPRLAELPRNSIGNRYGNEPGLSRFAALDAQISAPAPASKRVSSAAPQGARAINVARLSLPTSGARRFVGGAPVLSQNTSGDGSRLSRTETVRRVPLVELMPLPVSSAMSGIARAVRISAPTLIERALTQPSKLVRQTQKTGVKTPRAASVNPSKSVAVKARPRPIEVAPYAPTTPRLSASKTPGIGGEAVSPLSKAAPRAGQGARIAALPRPDANSARGPQRNAITIVPVETPLQVAAVDVPASFTVERTMSLRAVAARFGLPVELVALSNNWTPDMKLLKGTTVRLPRPLQVSYNGAPVAGEVPSMLLGDTGVTAFRFLFEQSGGHLQWDAANQRVVARKDGKEIVLNIGSKIAKVGDKEVAMELAAFLFEGRTMVPLRFFEESLNAQVDWNPQTGRLVVAMAGE